MSNRPLHFVWLCDGSGSMRSRGNIQQLNAAIRGVLPAMKQASEQAGVRLLMRAVRFASGAAWHVEAPTPVEAFAWPDLAADGLTSAGAALQMALDALAREDGALPPVLVLVADGGVTDPEAWASAIARLGEPKMSRAARLAVAVGDGVDYEMLEQFTGDVGKIFHASSAAGLAEAIQKAASAALGPPLWLTDPGDDIDVIPRHMPRFGDKAPEVW